MFQDQASGVLQSVAFRPLVMRAFPLLEQAGQNRIREFSARCLGISTYSFLCILVRFLYKRGCKVGFEAQGLSNMSWAFSSATMLSAPFAGKLGEQAASHVYTLLITFQ